MAAIRLNPTTHTHTIQLLLLFVKVVHEKSTSRIDSTDQTTFQGPDHGLSLFLFLSLSLFFEIKSFFLYHTFLDHLVRCLCHTHRYCVYSVRISNHHTNHQLHSSNQKKFEKEKFIYFDFSSVQSILNHLISTSIMMLVIMLVASILSAPALISLLLLPVKQN